MDIEEVKVNAMAFTKNSFLALNLKRILILKRLKMFLGLWVQKKYFSVHICTLIYSSFTKLIESF